jgi:hypothetical protein
VATDVVEYEAIIRQADAEASTGRYKEAYNLLGRGPWRGAPQDQDVRYRRGRYAYEVAHQRLDDFQRSPTPKLTLIKAGCWLARSEAYLSSATETSDNDERRAVEADLQRTEREQERFRALAAEFGESLFVSRGEKLEED